MEEYFNKVIASIKEWVRGIVQYAITAVPSTDGYDQVKGREVGPNDPQYQIGVRRFGNYGFRSLPPAGSEAILVNINGSLGNKAEIASENIAYGPSTDPKSNDTTSNFSPLKEGEVSIFSKFKSLLRFKTSGDISADAGTNANIVFNGGTAKVARVGDHARITLRGKSITIPGTPPQFTFSQYIVGEDGVTETLLFSFTAVGAITVPGPGVPYDINLDSKIYEGAEHVLA